MGGKGKGESNEDAMLRMIAEQGGKGDGKGKGKGKGKDWGKGKKGADGGPPSSDELPLARREELKAQVEAFVQSGEEQLALPTTITGLERKYLHEVVDELGLTSQSFGQGRDRYLCIFRAPGAAKATASEKTDPGEAPDSGGASYSSAVLTDDSRAKLRSFCEKAFTHGIPSEWTSHCDHMTICLGPLSDPSTEDHRSCAGAVKERIGALRDGQAFDLKVVSTGETWTCLAVGVIGCPSSNRNPHVTVATAPNTAANQSNFIRQWKTLPTEEQIDLQAVVWQRGYGRRERPPASTGPTGAQGAAVASSAPDAPEAAAWALEAAARAARRALARMRGGRPRRKEALKTELKRQRIMPKGLFLVHPVAVVQALGAEVPRQDEVLGALAKHLRQPGQEISPKRQRLEYTVKADHCTGAEVPSEVLERVRREMRHCSPALAQNPKGMANWFAGKAYVGPGFDIDKVIDRLMEEEVLSLGDDGVISYSEAMLGYSEAMLACTISPGSGQSHDAPRPYLEPWPCCIEKPPVAQWEVELRRTGWTSLGAATSSKIEAGKRGGAAEVSYTAKGKDYTINLSSQVQTTGRGHRNRLRRLA